MEELIPDVVVRKDGQGQYLWDPVIWALAAGAVVLIVAAVLAMYHFTPPPQDGGLPRPGEAQVHSH
jgi:hypothetical protein